MNTCARCYAKRPPVELLLITDVREPSRSFHICKVSVSATCFLSAVQGADRHRIAEAAAAPGRMSTD